MSRTVIDLDDDLVAEVARALGTRTKKDTVNTALREVLENRRRAVALTRLREAATEATDRARGIADFRSLFGWVPVRDRAFARAWEVQGELTTKGQHRSAGPVDLVVAATAELHSLTLLHHDRDFGVIARVTGQPLRWYGPD